jgi:thiol:disulfide interchange protein DsbD
MQKTIRASLILCAALCVLSNTIVGAQGFQPEPVFGVLLKADRAPLVAGQDLKLAVVISIDSGWHINTDDPGDEFMVPTSLDWQLPEEWGDVKTSFPAGEGIRFDFSDQPIMVWEERAVIIGQARVPASAEGAVTLTVGVTAQACNDKQCLPPLTVSSKTEVTVAPAGSEWEAENAELFATASRTEHAEIAEPATARPEAEDETGFADKSLPLFLIGVFLAGLALNLTPCVFPLIPITIGFFSQQAKDRSGGTFWMALAYVIGIAVTYSVLGVVTALSGKLLGAIMQNPWVIGGIAAVLIALATSMFGLWEFRTPSWAHSAAGSRGGLLGSLLMGLMMGLVAAPCIGPFVLGLLTLVGQKGDPVFGFFAFFTLAMGLGLPYLVLGTFTGAVNKLPMSGMWMVGVRRVFGVILIAMAAFFAAPLLPGDLGGWLLSATLVLGGLYLLVIDRTGNDQPGVDRLMRLLTVIMIVVGVLMSPFAKSRSTLGEHLAWQPYEASQVEAAIAGGGPVIVDFYADWCVPCRELDEKTFADPRVAGILAGYTRFKVDQTRSDDAAAAVAQQFGVLGVPTVIVYTNGQEKFRITGFEKADRFLKRLE